MTTLDGVSRAELHEQIRWTEGRIIGMKKAIASQRPTPPTPEIKAELKRLKDLCSAQRARLAHMERVNGPVRI